MVNKNINEMKGLEFEVINVEKNYNFQDSITIFFKKGAKKGYCSYRLIGSEQEKGIDFVGEYIEEEGEDIYEEINEWVKNNIEIEVIIKQKGEIIK